MCGHREAINEGLSFYPRPYCKCLRSDFEQGVLNCFVRSGDEGSGWKWGRLLQCVLSLRFFFVSVMIPAYTQNRVCALFFIIFTLIGKCLWVCMALGCAHPCVTGSPCSRVAGCSWPLLSNSPWFVSVTWPQSTLILEFPLPHSL